MNDKTTYAAIFITSVLYAPLLSIWKRVEPIGYHQTTWLQTVIGVGYVLLWLRVILSWPVWIKVCAAFFFSSIPVIIRSLTETALQNRDYNKFNGR